MNATSVANIVLRVNGDNAQKTIDNLEKRLRLATEAEARKAEISEDKYGQITQIAAAAFTVVSAIMSSTS